MDWSLGLLVVIAFALGASLASFGGVVYARWGTEESILGRSHCNCGRQLSWHENIPVIGWLRAKFRPAKCCNPQLPAWIIISEAGAGLVCALLLLIML